MVLLASRPYHGAHFQRSLRCRRERILEPILHVDTVAWVDAIPYEFEEAINIRTCNAPSAEPISNTHTIPCSEFCWLV